jgi:hypothetical protein
VTRDERFGGFLVPVAVRRERPQLGKIAHQVAAPITASHNCDSRLAIAQNFDFSMLPQSG